jgi:pilus assembly protein CpaE
MSTRAAPGISTAVASRSSLLAFVADDLRATVVDAAGRLGLGEAETLIAAVAEARSVLASTPTPKHLVVDVSAAADPLSFLSGLADVCDEGTHVVAVGLVNDINLYRALVAAGVDDYLLQPVSGQALADVLSRLDRPEAATAPAAPAAGGNIIAFVGVRGGVGASTLAVNCAWLMAQEFALRTALVDLDLYFGTCGLALDLEPQRGFRQALESPERIDGLFLERCMVRATDTLFVLAAEDDLDNPHGFSPEALRLLIDHLRGQFPVVVFDMPRFAARTQVALLSPPVTLALVADPSLACVRDAVRVAETFKKKADPSADLVVVLNRVGTLKGGEVGSADFTSGIGVASAFAVPFDAKAAIASATSGQPLARVAPKSKAAQEMRRLAQHFLPTAAKPPVPRWRRLLSLGR